MNFFQQLKELRPEIYPKSSASEKTEDDKNVGINFFKRLKEEQQPAPLQPTPTEQEPGLLDEATRLGAQWGSRILEMIVDVPYQIQSLGKAALAGDLNIIPVPEKIRSIGKQLPGGLPERLKESIYGQPDGTIGALPQIGGQYIKEQLSQATEGFTDPQAYWERRIGEGLQTLASLFFPGQGRGLGRNPTRSPINEGFRTFSRKVGTTIGSELSKEGVKVLGGGDTAQEATKMGSLFLLSSTLPTLFGQNSARQFNRNLYNESFSYLPQGARTGAGQLQNEINAFRNSNDLRGIQSGIRGELNTALDQLEGIIENGTVDVRLLSAQRARINEMRDRFYREGLVQNVDQERRLLGRMMNIVDNTLDAYGQAANPQFLNSFRTATQVSAALQQSNRVSNFFRKHLPLMKTKTPAVILFEGGAQALSKIPKVGAAAAIAQGTSNMAALQFKIFRSPALRRYYMNVVTNALREDGPAMIRSFQKLEDQLIKEENSNQKRKNISTKQYNLQLSPSQ